mgnify:CR=1 FL=1
MIEYTEVGKEYTQDKKDILPELFANLEWVSVNERRTVAMMPAMAIQQIIKEQKGDHTHYAISRELAPLGLYGIHSEFKNASVNSYWVDSGDAVTCIATNAAMKPDANAALVGGHHEQKL